MLLVFALLLTLLTTTRAVAQGQPEIVWDAPAGCPELSTVKARVAEWLAPAAGESRRADASRVQAVAVIRAEPGGYRLTLQFRSAAGSGSETLLAGRCETLMDVVALKVALAADAAALHSLVEPRRRPKPAIVYQRLTIGASSGVLPAGAPSLAGALGLRWQRLALEMVAHYELPREASYVRLRSVGGSFSLGAGEARVCLLAALERVQVPLCLGVLAGAIRADGFGTPRSQVSRQPWVALPVTVALRWPSDARWGLWAEVSAMVSLLRPDFYVRNLGQLHRSDPVAARGLCGLELHFP